MNNDRQPAWKMKKVLTLNCEFSLCGLILVLVAQGHQTFEINFRRLQYWLADKIGHTLPTLQPWALLRRQTTAWSMHNIICNRKKNFLANVNIVGIVM